MGKLLIGERVAGDGEELDLVVVLLGEVLLIQRILDNTLGYSTLYKC